MQTPIKPVPGIKPPRCQLCHRQEASVIVYSPRTKRRAAVCAGCAAEDAELEKKYRVGERWNWSANAGDDEPL